MMAERVYECSCGAAGGDRGELEEHILTRETGEHDPVIPEHVTPRITAHLDRVRRRGQAQHALAKAAGITVDELKAALRQ